MQRLLSSSLHRCNFHIACAKSITSSTPFSSTFSTMAPRKIVIFGATGNQGQSVARALLEDGPDKFDVVGITRNPNSRSSQATAELGIKLVRGDLDDPSSYEEHLKGADGVFINADFWIHFKGNNSEEAKAAEIRQAKGAVDAAYRGGVKHVVYSTLESYEPRQRLPHFESKAEVTKYMKSIGVPSTQLYLSAYYSNFLGMRIVQHGDKLIMPYPLPDDTVIPGFAPEQIGLWARVAFRDPETWIGKDMIACGENITVAGMAEVLSELIGRKVDTMHRHREYFFSDEVRGRMAEETWLNYLAFLNGEMKRDIKASRAIVPEAWDFRTWASNTPEVFDMFAV